MPKKDDVLYVLLGLQVGLLIAIVRELDKIRTLLELIKEYL